MKLRLGQKNWQKGEDLWFLTPMRADLQPNPCHLATKIGV
jgi:hypothetical protein